MVKTPNKMGKPRKMPSANQLWFLTLHRSNLPNLVIMYLF